MGSLKTERMKSGVLDAKQKESYNRFFINAFIEGELDEIIEAGGGEDIDNFKKTSKNVMSKQDYWDRMFAGTFRGRDGKQRESKYNRLGDAIFDNYLKGKRIERKPVTTKTYFYTSKKGTKFSSERSFVQKGNKIIFGGKTYKGGQFLPKKYFK